MAENEIVETPQVEQVSTPAPEAPAPEPVVSEAPKESFDQTLERVARQATAKMVRGPDGRFAAVEAPGAPAVEVPGSPQAAPPDPAPPVIEAPQSLPADVKAKWDSFPPEAKQWLANREKEIHQKFTTDGERLKTLAAFEDVLKPLDARLKQVNAPAHEYVRRLAAADQLLATNGLEGIRQIAAMYGIDLHAALQQPHAQFTPQVDIRAQVDQAVEARLREQTVVQSAKEIEKFRSGLPAEEQADFDKLENIMVGLAGAKPGRTIADLYKAARYADDDTRTKDEAKAKQEAEKKATEEAKERAAKDAKIAPFGRKPGATPTAPIKGKTWQETLDRVAREVTSRA